MVKQRFVEPKVPWRHCFGIALAACILGAPTAASAYTFEPNGALRFDPNAVFVEDFEVGSTQSTIGIVEGNAISGTRYAHANYDSGRGFVELFVGGEQKSVVIRALVRGNVGWYALALVYNDFDKWPNRQFAVLSPTGTMTSDGWMEIESAPIRINPAVSQHIYVSFMTPSLDVDAIEVVPVADPLPPTRKCSRTNPCGSGLACWEGWCQNPQTVVPAIPSAATRKLVADVFRAKIEAFFGGVHSRQEPKAKAQLILQQLPEMTTAWDYWKTFALATSTLSDSHTLTLSPASYIGSEGPPLPVCFVEGDADTTASVAPSHAIYKDILVSHVGQPIPGLNLRQGDRLVYVDSQHPIEWMRSRTDFPWFAADANDPDVVSGWVEALPTAIRALASDITVIRCRAGGTCSRPEIIQLSTLHNDPNVPHPVCDHRPSYHLARNNPDPTTHDFEDVRYGLLADSQPGEDLYGMIWNDTLYYDETRPPPWKPAYDTFRRSAKGIVLDHRRGDGGTAPGAAYLTTLSRPRIAPIAVYPMLTTLRLFDAPFSNADGRALFRVFSASNDWLYNVGSSQWLPGVRIALMLARDVSGSDFFPWAVKGSANTRIFGRKTMGAFSTFYTLDTPSFLIIRLASGDLIDANGNTNIGKGVEPDVDIVPLQSDLIEGVDTVYKRALAWVRCGQEVCP